MANRIVTWSANQRLDAADLNGEFNNIYDGTIERTAGRWGQNDDIPIDLGTSQDVQIEWDTTQTQDALLIGVSGSNTIMLLEKTDMSTDFLIAAQTNPTFVVHSADSATAADYIWLSHNQTDGVINAGAGGIDLQIAGTRSFFVKDTTTIITAAGDRTIDLTGAATRTLSILNSTASQVTNVSIDGALTVSGTGDSSVAGEFGVNQTAPTSQLHVVSGAAGKEGLIVDTAASPTADVAIIKMNGTQYQRFVVSGSENRHTLETANLGNNVAGPSFTVGRNSSAGAEGGAAGAMNFRQGSAGADNYVWADSSAGTGVVRIFTSAPTGSAGAPTVADTAGTVVGAQTSWYELKQNITEFTNYQEALDVVLKTPLHSFDMNGDHYEAGYVIHEKDIGSWFSWNDDLKKQQIPALNERQIFGYHAGAIKALHAENEALKTRVVTLERRVN